MGCDAGVPPRFSGNRLPAMGSALSFDDGPTSGHATVVAAGIDEGVGAADGIATGGHAAAADSAAGIAANRSGSAARDRPARIAQPALGALGADAAAAHGIEDLVWTAGAGVGRTVTGASLAANAVAAGAAPSAAGGGAEAINRQRVDGTATRVDLAAQPVDEALADTAVTDRLSKCAEHRWREPTDEMCALEGPPHPCSARAAAEARLAAGVIRLAGLAGTATETAVVAAAGAAGYLSTSLAIPMPEVGPVAEHLGTDLFLGVGGGAADGTACIEGTTGVWLGAGVVRTSVTDRRVGPRGIY